MRWLTGQNPWLFGTTAGVLTSLAWLLRDVFAAFLPFWASFALLLLPPFVFLVLFALAILKNPFGVAGVAGFGLVSGLCVWQKIEYLTDFSPLFIKEFVYRRVLARKGIELPKEIRALRLRYLGGVFWDGIAVRLEVPESATKSLIAREQRAPGEVMIFDPERYRFRLCSSGFSLTDLTGIPVRVLEVGKSTFTPLAGEIYAMQHKANLLIKPSGEGILVICTANG